MQSGIRTRPWAGLDVGTFSVKLVALPAGATSGKPLSAEIPLPSSLPNDGPPTPDTLARLIAEAFGRVGLSPRSIRGITLGLSGPDVIVKQISLPLLADDEVGPALRFEARKHLPFDLQSMVVDYQVLARYPTEKRLEVLLAAVSLDRLAKAQAPLLALGIEPDIVDAAPLALTNALVAGREAEREAQVLLDLGHTSSHFTLWQRGEPFFGRRLDFGGAALTRAIASETRVPIEEAEEWKLAAGSDQPGFRVDWASPEMQAILDALRRDLVEDLRRSFAFYRTIGKLPDPMKLWLSGGTARIPGLASRLGELLGFPVLLFNPLDRGQREGAHFTSGPQFAQAYGLALRSV
jgi:type IV pilus assembly protein PilM